MRVVIHFARWCFGRAPAETQTSLAERRCLARHAAGRRRVVEVGVWHGVTTALLRSVMATDGVLYAVDPFPRGRLGVSFQRLIARAEVGRVDTGTVHWFRMSGAEAAQAYRRLVGAPVDFVFLDGDHRYAAVRADWAGWSDLVAPGGIVALHDSRSTPERPLDGVGSAILTREIVEGDRRFTVIDEVETLTVLRRRVED